MFTDVDYFEMTGLPPKNDDLERLNCEHAGKTGRYFCGYCREHQKPRNTCGCIDIIRDEQTQSIIDDMLLRANASDDPEILRAIVFDAVELIK